MNNRQTYKIINSHLQDILNAIIDIRRSYSGGHINNKNKDYATFANITDTLNRIDEIKYKSQDSMELMLKLEIKEN
jgi:hypothetical protein